MGLITKEVEVTVGNQRTYYEKLGYKIPKIKNSSGRWTVPSGTKIIVKVYDLPKNSRYCVEATCDECEKLLNMQYGKYIERNHTGKTYCHGCANKIFNSGENNYKWNPNLSDEERINGRHYVEYTEFIKRVLARDNYTCQCCGNEVSGDLEVHHLDGYNWCVEKRTDDTNGITLCHNCHYNFHLLYGRGNNTKEQFEEWIGRTIEILEYDNILPTVRKIYCIEQDKIYDSAIDVMKALGLKDKTGVYGVCNHIEHYNSVVGKHLLWLDEYERMTQEDLKTYLETCKNKSCREVICVNTKKVYKSCADANRDYGLPSNATGIRECCCGRNVSSGSLSDGTPLFWMYYDEYLVKIHNGEDVQIPKSPKFTKIICVTTGEIFNRIKIAAEKYGVKTPYKIADVCNPKTRSKTSGSLPDGTRLQWMYYEDFLKLPQDKQNEILSRNKELSTV